MIDTFNGFLRREVHSRARTNVMSFPSNGVKEGWLVKAPTSQGSKHSPSIFAQNRKRYFVLEPCCLKYYEKEGGKMKGSIELCVNTFVELRADTNTLLVVPYPGAERELLLSADQHKILEEWAEAIKKVARSPDVVEVEESKTSDLESLASDESPGTQRNEMISREQSQAQEQKEWKLEWGSRLRSHTHLPHVHYKTIIQGPLDIVASAEVGLLSIPGSVHWNSKFVELKEGLRIYESEEECKNDPSTGNFIPLEAVVAKMFTPEWSSMNLSPSDAARSIIVFTLGERMTLRCPSPHDATDWVKCISNSSTLLQPLAAPVPNKVAIQDKKVPDFLVGVKDRVLKAKPLVLPVSPPIPCSSPQYESTTKLEQEEYDEGGECCEDSSKTMPEDRFAKLRALRTDSIDSDELEGEVGV